MPLVSSATHLYVFDIERSCALYERALGFRTVVCEGVPPHYAELERDAVRIALRCVKSPIYARDDREQQELLAVSIETESLEQLQAIYDHALRHGGRIRRPIEARAWGAWIFIMRDLDGNMLLFSAPRREGERVAPAGS